MDTDMAREAAVLDAEAAGEADIARGARTSDKEVAGGAEILDEDVIDEIGRSNEAV